MYLLTHKRVVVDDKEYTVYGIRYSDEIFIGDLSCDRDRVERLVADCNRYSLDPLHLRDVAEDFLAE